jgi:hypothetical protein
MVPDNDVPQDTQATMRDEIADPTTTIPFTYCDPYDPKHPSVFDDTAPLSTYIQRAEIKCFETCISKHPIFPVPPAGVTPMLRKDRENRILLFAGCFNPPHLGHLELLAHVFLRTDSHTIAAMLLPVGSGSNGKASGTVNGEEFGLSASERAALLQDEALSRFTWCYTGAYAKLEAFQKALIRGCRKDGYSVVFTELSGSDHYATRRGLRGPGRGSGGLITSDVTRPCVMLAGGRHEPAQLDGCSAWRKILPAKSVVNKGTVFCWPCRKFQTMCPEVADEKPLMKSKLYD